MATNTAPAPHLFTEPEHSSFEHSIFHGVRLALSKVGAGVIGAFESLAASQRAAHHFERLTILSDSELAARGLARENLPNYVFEQHFARM